MKYKLVVICPRCGSEDIYPHGPDQPLVWFCASCRHRESYKTLEDCFREDDTVDPDAV